MKNTFLVVLFLLVFTSAIKAQEVPAKAVELSEVAIVKVKKAVEQKADRTIFDFASQPSLNSGSVLEGIRKLPGLIASDVAGMMYQGKQLDVFLDGRPLNISSNELNSFLEGMPANAIEKIEIITQPGAEFPATSGGAIMNIITNVNAKKYLSATYTNSTNFTNYDKLRWRLNNSLLLSAKNKYFGWQLNLGQSYNETKMWTSLTKNENNINSLISNTEADRIGRTNFVKTAVTFDIGKDRLLLNYDLNYSNNNSNTLGNGIGFNANDDSFTKAWRQDFVVTFQKKFDDRSKKLDFKFNYSKNENEFILNSLINNTSILDNDSNQQLYNAKFDYSQPISFSDEGKLSFGGLYESLLFRTQNMNVVNLEYQRRTAAAYGEFQTKFNKLNFIIGGRAENYNINGKTNTADLIPFKQFRFFPNASAQYNFTESVYINVNYNKKISLPSTSSLNPNNTNYQNPNVDYFGNPNLQPTIFDNYEIKLSAFDYAYIGYNVSAARNQVINRLLLTNNVALNTSINVPEIKVHNFNIGIPLPYMLFTKGLKETMKMNVNPDTMNFLYIYTAYQYHQIPEIKTNGFWMFNLMSQILLPKDIKFVTHFNYTFPKGNYFYFIVEEPLRNSVDVSFSKKFFNNQVSVSISADDIFNSNRSVVSSFNTPLILSNKNDSRRFGFSINYKIPTRNKLAKEDPSLLNKEKKEEQKEL